MSVFRMPKYGLPAPKTHIWAYEKRPISNFILPILQFAYPRKTIRVTINIHLLYFHDTVQVYEITAFALQLHVNKGHK